VTTKRCCECHQVLPLAEFPGSLAHLYGVATRCRTCYNRREKRRREAAKVAGAPLHRRAQERWKAGVLEHYSGETPRCACCANQYRPHLTIDHAEQNGAAHRRALKAAGDNRHFYRWLKENGFPDGFRVLCYNCNFAAYRLGHCACQSSGVSTAV
jgi:hypothetical protein